MAEEKKIRVILAKTGLESHTRGIEVVGRWLRDAGMEVILLGSYQTAESVAKTAIEEDADIIGLSFLGGQHLVQVPKMVARMKENNLNIPLIVGGVIPSGHIPRLKEMGAAAVFPANSRMEEIVQSVRELAGAAKDA